MSNELYTRKKKKYFNEIRHDAIDVLNEYIGSQAGLSILEVGCGACDTLVHLKKEGSAKIVDGVELMEITDSNQQSIFVDSLVISSVEDALPLIKNEYYDVILALDVLEHLVDPWDVVNMLSTKLKPGGHLVVSCPNIREIRTIIRLLLLGDFDYAESGILDKTHLRFFTPRTLGELVTTSDLEFVSLVPNYKLGPNRKKIRKLHFGKLDQLLASQYFAISRKVDSGKTI